MFIRVEQGVPTSTIARMSSSPDGRLLATTGLDKVVRIWDAESLETKQVLRGEIGEEFRGELYAVDFSRSGVEVLSGGADVQESGAQTGMYGGGAKQTSSLRVFDRVTGKIIRRLEGHPGNITAIASSPNKDEVFVGDNSKQGSIFHWNYVSGKLLSKRKLHSGEVYALDVSEDGKFVLSGSYDGTACLWASDSGELVWRKRIGSEVLAVRFATKGQETLAVIGSRQGKILCFGKDGRSAGEYKADSAVTSLAFVPKGEEIVASSGEAGSATDAMMLRLGLPGLTELSRNTVPVGTIYSTEYLARRKEFITGGIGGEMWRFDPQLSAGQQIKGIGEPVRRIWWSKEGTSIGWSAGQDPSPKVAFALNRPSVRQAEPESDSWTRNTEEVSFKVSGQKLTVQSETIVLPTMSSQESIRKLVTTKTGLIVATDFRLLVFEGKERRWSEATGHEGPINDLQLDPSGRWLASGAEDQTVRLWDLQQQPRQIGLLKRAIRPLISVFGASSSTWVAWHPDGAYIASPMSDQFIGFHRNNGPGTAADFFPASQFRDRFNQVGWFSSLFKTGNLEQAKKDFESKPSIGASFLPAPVPVEQVLETSPPPTIDILDVTPATLEGTTYRTKAPEVQVTAKLLGTADGDYEIVANVVSEFQGRDLKIVPAKRRVSVVPVSVSLQKGLNRIVLFGRGKALDNSEVTALKTIEIVREQEEESVPIPNTPSRIFVLSVGVSQYKNPEASLQYAARDSQILSEFFADEELRDVSEIYSIVNQNATIPKIKAALEELRSKVTKNDLLIVHISGHGNIVPNQGKLRFAFLPHEFSNSDIEGTTLLWQDLLKAVDEIPSKFSLIFADTCRSGGLISEFIEYDTNSVLSGEISSLERGVVAVLSCSPSEKSYEFSKLQNGIFTYELVKALKELKNASGGRADLESLYYLVRRDVQEYVYKEAKRFQTPLLCPPISLLTLGGDVVEELYRSLFVPTTRSSLKPTLNLSDWHL